MTVFRRFVAFTIGLIAGPPVAFAAALSLAAAWAETPPVMPPATLPAGWQSFRLDSEAYAIDRPSALVAVTPEAGRDEITIHAEWRVPDGRGTFYVATFPPLIGGRTLVQWAEEAAADQGPAPVKQITLGRDVAAVTWAWLEAGYYERRVAVQSARTGRVVALLYAMETNAKTLQAAERDFKKEIDLQDQMAATIRLGR